MIWRNFLSVEENFYFATLCEREFLVFPHCVIRPQFQWKNKIEINLFELNNSDDFAQECRKKYHLSRPIRSFSPVDRKFQKYSATQILREIKLWAPRNSKDCQFDILGALNLEFGVFLHFKTAKICPKTKIHCLWKLKNGSLWSARGFKIISCKI